MAPDHIFKLSSLIKKQKKMIVNYAGQEVEASDSDDEGSPLGHQMSKIVAF
jgi:hypothetical protein